MTELLAALMGAVIGGAISAGVAIWQTKQTLAHDMRTAREEREAARVAEVTSRQQQAATYLLGVLADYATPMPRRGERDLGWFGGSTASFDARVMRVADLRRAGNERAHLLPDELAARWRTLVWLAQWVARPDASRSEHVERDSSDAWAYAEYVKRSLLAFLKDQAPPGDVTAPDPDRSEERVWGWKPPAGTREPDLTDWMKARFGGHTTLRREDGITERLPPEP